MPKSKRKFYRVARWVTPEESKCILHKTTLGPYRFAKWVASHSKELHEILWKNEPFNTYIVKRVKRNGKEITWGDFKNSPLRASFLMPRAGPYEDPLLKNESWRLYKEGKIDEYIFAFDSPEQMQSWFNDPTETKILINHGFVVFLIKSSDYYLGHKQCLVKDAEIIKEFSLRTFLLTDRWKTLNCVT